MPDLTPAAQAALDAVTDDEVRETAEMCERFGVPAEYAAGVAAIMAVCNPDGAL
jgi:hypothetical protein